ncbi:MAG: penicillin-binding protein activator [Betaproteobacteria bacterium]|nr:MAG: penicillin-binding protein activator [Betaproteobacteria bacterium]
MQRHRAPRVLLTALLYFALSAAATQHVLAQGWQWPQNQRPPLTTEPEEPRAEPAPIEERSLFTQAHVGVVLPLQSSAYARLAEQVRLGILTASKMSSYNALPVIVYSTTGDTQGIVQAYEQAVRDGARVIIGPLTRDGVSAVAESTIVAVPTVTLNVPDASITLPRQMYVFGLQIETEAEQVARLAFTHGGRKVLLVVSQSALSQRIARAFAQQWKALKGDISDEFIYSTEALALASLRDLLDTTAADVAFLAVNAPRARFIRAYLGTQFPIYATSLVYASSADKLELYDLDGVRFMDMPWLLQEDHPAVMTYLRAPLDSSALDEERFYALGIDAYRISQSLLDNSAEVPTIDGVTGLISLDQQQRFTHQLTPAFFSYGTARMLNEEPGTEQ